LFEFFFTDLNTRSPKEKRAKLKIKESSSSQVANRGSKFRCHFPACVFSSRSELRLQMHSRQWNHTVKIKFSKKLSSQESTTTDNSSQNSESTDNSTQEKDLADVSSHDSESTDDSTQICESTDISSQELGIDENSEHFAESSPCSTPNNESTLVVNVEKSIDGDVDVSSSKENLKPKSAASRLPTWMRKSHDCSFEGCNFAGKTRYLFYFKKGSKKLSQITKFI
jgi:hypothetical protein